MAHSQSSALRPRIHPLTHLVAITTRISTRNIKTSITFWPANPATRPPWTTASDRLPRPDLFQVEAPYPDCATTASDRRHTTVPCRTWPATSAIRSLLAVTPTCWISSRMSCTICIHLLISSSHVFFASVERNGETWVAVSSASTSKDFPLTESTSVVGPSSVGEATADDARTSPRGPPTPAGAVNQGCHQKKSPSTFFGPKRGFSSTLPNLTKNSWKIHVFPWKTFYFFFSLMIPKSGCFFPKSEKLACFYLTINLPLEGGFTRDQVLLFVLFLDRNKRTAWTWTATPPGSWFYCLFAACVNRWRLGEFSSYQHRPSIGWTIMFRRWYQFFTFTDWSLSRFGVSLIF